MDLFSIKTIKELLDQKGLAPKKGLGQNFLVEKRVAALAVQAAGLSAEDFVLEIGPGIGTLTAELARAAKTVTAVEKDADMVSLLKETMRGHDNISIIRGDILTTDISSLTPLRYPHLNGVKDERGYKVVANLPYYAAAPIIRKFLETNTKPSVMVFMTQKEVAQRICAKPPDMNILAASVQLYALPSIVSFVKKSAFWPQPAVDSALIKLVPKQGAPPAAPAIFFAVVKAGFAHPRKQIFSNMRKSLPQHSPEIIAAWLSAQRVDPKQRAETIALETWVSLAKTFPGNTL
ncbi:MAG: ribosomal RNA small subunit methyltransferase A [Candidatus Wildermuthbacteria bacterium]|nr:ribosomal RNA small subunit methyltransferase A [Candidatus Wildermuthbacteria bacterium]